MRITRLTARIGAEVGGVRLGGGLPADVVAEIRRALLSHKVLFFRHQDHLDEGEQVAFGRLLGDLTTAHPTMPAHDENAYIFDIDYLGGKKVDRWHTDVTFVPRPPMAGILRALVVPSAGGDTLWASTVAAYEHLPAELRDLLDRLRAVHTNQYDYARVVDADDPEQSRERYKAFTSTVYETEHPVVHVIPETGERAILLGYSAKYVQGMSAQASASVLELIQDQVTQVENTVRWRWAAGDVAVWDNRATQHRVVHDFGRERRRLHRVALAGELPVGVDGRPSRAVAGTKDTVTV